MVNQTFTNRVFSQVPLLTLASGAAIAIPVSSALPPSEDFAVYKLEAWMSVEGKTTGEGPLLFGVADGELSVAEIAEALTAAVVDQNSRLQVEKSTRPVWELAMLDTIAVGGLITPNGGNHPLEWKLKKGWTFSEPEGIQMWIMNLDDATLTTGCVVKTHVKTFGRWIL